MRTNEDLRKQLAEVLAREARTGTSKRQFAELAGIQPRYLALLLDGGRRMTPRMVQRINAAVDILYIRKSRLGDVAPHTDAEVAVAADAIRP